MNQNLEHLPAMQPSMNQSTIISRQRMMMAGGNAGGQGPQGGGMMMQRPMGPSMAQQGQPQGQQMMHGNNQGMNYPQPPPYWQGFSI